jgi:hypothetical protein
MNCKGGAVLKIIFGTGLVHLRSEPIIRVGATCLFAMSQMFGIGHLEFHDDTMAWSSLVFVSLGKSKLLQSDDRVDRVGQPRR